MGNCLARQSDSPNSRSNSNNGANNNQLGSCQLSIRHNNSRLLQSTSSSTLLGRSSISAGNSRLFGPSSSNTYTTSNTNTSLLGSDISQTFKVRGEEEFPNGQILDVANLIDFTFEELKAATRNFRPDSVLGEGGFGRVYKGWLKDRASSSNNRYEGLVVAVKRLNSDSTQGITEWQSEVNFLGRLSHPNLVKLYGYGRENGELFLVYEYMHRGSLANHIFGRGSNVRPLPWDTRLKIMIGAARGLNFLHSLENRIIYRDFKPSNILLDKSYIAKLADFGLAKTVPSGGRTHVTTRVMGTYGYAAPEYVVTGHLTMKSDVYGFGIVLVEILTGKAISDILKHMGKDQSLVDWIKANLLSRWKMRETMDRRLEGKYPPKLALQVAQLALKCVGTEYKLRPPMKEVVEALEQVEAANDKTTDIRKRAIHSGAAQLHGRPDGG
ncbi:probable serine/threonine-protein kinase PIX13 isoform X2 [Prosopis cineraria]|uniref:probable serine/threonine-protein kinase PIX13 isoform X2 n=1 Tax=Prosopis cineraria TaxID=364024 RepID=UPI00240F1A3C|nr:probable serine/threonine-protein kinase PIX13 isoform X2 [Prosopis cineraria]